MNLLSPFGRKWGVVPMTTPVTGPIRELVPRLPVFRLAAPESLGLGANRQRAFVVGASAPAVPVGFVSPNYNLIQHARLAERAARFACELAPGTIPMLDGMLSANGEHFVFMIKLQPETGPDGERMRLHLRCSNSVDGSSSLSASLCWVRLVCSNGMAVGVNLGRSAVRHDSSGHVEDAFLNLRDRVPLIAEDEKTFLHWMDTKVCREPLRDWADGTLVKRWRPLAAARVWHIARTGTDVRFRPPFKCGRPTAREVMPVRAVPGSSACRGTLYGVAQALSWVASRRNDQQEMIEMQQDIGPLLVDLQASLGR